MSYTDIWIIPHADGGSHTNPNYEGESEFPSILLPDVHRSYAVAVVLPFAQRVRAVEVATLNLALAPMPTHGTGSTGVCFFLQDSGHAAPFRLVGEHMAKLVLLILIVLLLVAAGWLVIKQWAKF